MGSGTVIKQETSNYLRVHFWCARNLCAYLLALVDTLRSYPELEVKRLMRENMNSMSILSGCPSYIPDQFSEFVDQMAGFSVGPLKEGLEEVWKYHTVE